MNVEDLRPVRHRESGPPPREQRRAVFLDRDGVLNESLSRDGVPTPPRSDEELRIVAGAAVEVARLRAAGFLAIVVTNQPDVARGAVSAESVVAINGRVVEALELDDAYSCLHDAGDGCRCRKPAPGMLVAASRDWSIDLRRSWLIGDRWVDIAAGVAAGVRTVLLEHPLSWRPTSAGVPPSGLRPDHSASRLRDCVSWILDTASACLEEGSDA